MPKFLAIDYVTEAVAHYRKLLNWMLLTVPQNVDDMPCINSELSCDTLFAASKIPWCRAKYLKVGEVKIDEELHKLRSTEKLKLHQNEPYIREVSTHNSTFGTFEIVPSSNPDSQDSIDDDILIKLCESVGSQTGWENFSREDLCSLEAKESLLEEPVENHHIGDFLNNIICVEQLLQKLKPRVVKDPFVTKDGNDICENSVLSTEQEFEGARYDRTDQQKSCTLKVFPEKQQLSTEENCGFLEEEVHSILDINQIGDEADSYSDDLKYLLKAVHKKGSQELVKLDADLSEPELQDIISIKVSEKALLKKDVKYLCDSVEPKLQYKSFMEVNDESSMNKNDNTEKSKNYLESPGISFNASETCEVDYFPWKSLKKSQSLFKDESLQLSDIILVSSNEKDELEHKLKENEKYFDDVLALAISVPNVKKSSEENNLPRIAKDIFGLKEEKCSGSLELDMPWDPFFESNEVMKMCCRSDKQFHRLEKEVNLKQQKPSKDKLLATFLEKECLEGIVDPKTSALFETLDISSHESITAVKNNEKGTTLDSDLVVNDWDENTKNASGTSLKGDPIDDFIFLRKRSSLLNKTPIITSTVTGECQAPKKQLINDPNLIGVSQIDQEHVEEKIVSDVTEIDSETKKDIETYVTPATCRAITLSKQDGLVPSEYVAVNNVIGNSNATVSLIKRKCEKDKKEPTDIKKSENIPTGKRSKSNKSRIIEVPVTDTFVKIGSLLEVAAEEFLQLLKTTGLIPATQQFLTFTPDVSRYILKQHEKALSDNIADNETYQAVVGLHVLVSTMDMLLNCTLQCALTQLMAMLEKYQQHLKGILDNIKEDLCKVYQQHKQEHILHPKVVTLCKELATWYKRKQTKSPELDIKILIVIKHSLETLFHEITACVNELEGISAMAEIGGGQLTYHRIITSLDKHNCLIVCSDQMSEDFSWAQFSLVLQYQSTQHSEILECCSRQSIRYVGLIIKPWIAENSMLKKEANQKIDKEHKNEQVEEYTLIGSQNLTAWRGLLQELESKNHIQVIERDYDAISSLTGSKCYADVIIDERTCIVLHSLNGLKHGDNQYMLLVDRVKALQMQYEMCYVMFYSGNSSKKTDQYVFSGKVIPNISKTLAALGNLCENYHVKVLYACEYDEVATLVRSVCENALKTSPVWSKEDWINRTWLTPDVSQHEKMLLAIPCLNSFSIQMLLTLAPLATLASMSIDELMSACPWLPKKVIKKFHSVMTYNIQDQMLEKKQEKIGSMDINNSNKVINNEEINLPQHRVVKHISSSPDVEEVFVYSQSPRENLSYVLGQDSEYHESSHRLMGISGDEPFWSSSYEVEITGANSQDLSESKRPNEYEKACIEGKYWSSIIGDQSFRGENDTLLEFGPATPYVYTPQQPDIYYQPKIAPCNSHSYKKCNNEVCNSDDPLVSHTEKHPNVVSDQSVKHKFQWDSFVSGNSKISNINVLPVPKGQKDPGFSRYSTTFNDAVASAKLWNEFGDRRKKHSYIVNRKEDQNETQIVRSKNIPCTLTNIQNERDSQNKQKTEFVLREQGALRPVVFREFRGNSQPEENTSTNLSQDARPRTPGIAPVTPSIRHTRRPSDNLCNEYDRPRYMYTSAANESPPMDYDSDDEYAMSFGVRTSTVTPHNLSEIAGMSTSTRRANQKNIENFDRMTATPSKQRRLTYEKVPGTKSGQTRLNFA